MKIRKFCRHIPAFLVLALPLAGSAAELTLTPPGLTPYTGIDIGNVQIGGEINALSTFTIDSAGIFFNPFGNVTSQPKTYELDAYIYQVNGFGTTGYQNEGTEGALVATGQYCIGPCSSHTLFPANPENGALNWFDVPIAYTFQSGKQYLVEFNVLPDGWGSGLTAKNQVEFYAFDPNVGGTPFTVGPAQVIDGAFDGDLSVQNFAAIRLDTASTPEPATGGLIGGALLLLAGLAKRRSSASNN